MRISNKVKLKKLTRFIVVCIAIILVFTVVELILATVTGITHDTLTTCVFAFFGTELASCTLIKIFNILKLGE